MKILHLSSERSWRGGEQQIAYLVQESLSLGHEVHVICRKNSAFEKWCLSHTIQHLAVGFKNEFDIFSVLKIKSYCQKNQIQLLHAHSSHSHALGLFSKFLGNSARFVVSRRVDFPIKDNFFSKFKFNHPHVLQYICVSEAIQKILMKDLRHPKKCVTVHSGIDIEKFNTDTTFHKLRKEYSISPETKVIGNVSAIAPHKDYPTFIKTASEIVKQIPNVHFFIIGEGGERNTIEALIQTHDLASHITLTGFRTDVNELFDSLDIFLMTSETEGLGTTLLDAAANHIPIVSTNAGGIPEFVEHEVTGLVANVYDYQSLALHVIKVLKDEKLGKKLAANAHEKLKAHFTKALTAKKTIQIYQNLLG